MTHYKPINPTCVHNTDCLKCSLLKDCFPKTYEKRQKAIEKRWKDEYKNEF